jgi:chitin-binding protein
MSTRKRLIGTTIAAVVAAGLVVAGSGPAFGHGYVGAEGSDVISRGAHTGNVDRGAVQWEPQSLEAPGGYPAAGPADGQIASAGGLFGGNLDEQTADRWVKNDISAGPVDLVWRNTALHATDYWKYYITKPGWDPNDPLERSDFEEILHVDGTGAAQATESHTVTVPSDRQGYHVILAVWEIADTPMAFYNVIDVNVG